MYLACLCEHIHVVLYMKHAIGMVPLTIKDLASGQCTPGMGGQGVIR